MAHIKSTSFPTNPCRDFYEWYATIHGNCPVAIRERFTPFGERREPKPRQNDFAAVMARFSASLIPR